MLAACASDTSDATETPAETCHPVSDITPGSQQVDVTLREWSIEMSTTSLRSGPVSLIATNKGTMVHEMLVIRAASVESLPYAADGSIDEDGLAEADALGEIAEFEANTTCAHQFDLSPGHYVLLCNIVEGTDSHLKHGMIKPFTVTA